MGDIIITITKGDPATGILTLSDQGITNVTQGDQVTWVIGPGSGVGSISGIVEKPNSADVFSPDPAPVNGTSNWQGTVNPALPAGTEELYSINWVTGGTGWLGKDGAGQPKSYDPIIRIQPKNNYVV
ncbi:MAG: hypothetical protein IPK31_02550 [Chitinophagaceae bacterium]|nr:hypothetical protein [Chitinophagaceae bacterium]